MTAVLNDRIETIMPPVAETTRQDVLVKVNLRCSATSDLAASNRLLIELADRFAALLPDVKTTEALAAILDIRCAYVDPSGLHTVEFYIGDQRQIDASVKCTFRRHPMGWILGPHIIVRLGTPENTMHLLSFDLAANLMNWAPHLNAVPQASIELFNGHTADLRNLILAHATSII